VGDVEDGGANRQLPLLYPTFRIPLIENLIL